MAKPTAPPGLAKKPGGLPPGLAKKPGGVAPGQAKRPMPSEMPNATPTKGGRKPR